MNERLTATLNFLKRNTLVIFFAVLAGTFCIAPYLLATHDLGSAYRGVPLMATNDEDNYTARIREVYDGHLLRGSPFLYEYKNIIPVMPPIGEYFYVLLAVLIQVTLPHAVLLAKFLFPAILFLLVYTFIQKTAGNEASKKDRMWYGIAGAALVVLGYELVNYQLLFLMLKHGPQAVVSAWDRPVNPITGAIMLFTFLGLLWNCYVRASWKYTLSAGIAMLFSIGYVFSLGVELSVLFVLFLLSLYWKAYDLSRRLIAIGGIGLGLASLYWLPLLLTTHSEAGLAARNGMLYTHEPLLNKVLLTASTLIGALVIYGVRKHGVDLRDRKTYASIWFAFALVIAGFMVLNQQLFTGKTIWPHHFTQYTNALALLAVLMVAFTILRPYHAKLWRMIIVLCITSTMLLSLWEIAGYAKFIPDFKASQDFAPALSWLNTHATKDSVVLISQSEPTNLWALITGLTSCNVYAAESAYGDTPLARVKHDFLVQLRLRGATSDNIETYLLAHQDFMLSYFYSDFDEMGGLKKTDHMEKLIPGLAEDYREFLTHDLKQELKQYRIDYLLSYGELAPGIRESLPTLEEVFRSGTTTIYTVR